MIQSGKGGNRAAGRLRIEGNRPHALGSSTPLSPLEQACFGTFLHCNSMKAYDGPCPSEFVNEGI